MSNRQRTCRLAALAAVIVAAVVMAPGAGSRVAAQQGAGAEPDMYRRPVPRYDVTSIGAAATLPSAQQVAALDSFKTRLGDSSITARWEQSSGLLDVMYDFATGPSSLDPQSAAREFVAANAALFGIRDLATLQLDRHVEALGGHLLHFGQVHQGVPVAGGGIGVFMDAERRIKMVSGPYFSDLAVGASPGLSGADAVTRAQRDISSFAREWPAGVAEILNPAYDAFAAEIGPLATPSPELNVLPTADGARLAYSFYLFSRNPFGVFHYQIDAHSGELLYRSDIINYQQPLPYTADIYPASPVLANPDTGELATDENNEPEGLLRVQLRKFNTGANATAVEGTMSGTHALIKSLLASRQPFVQAAAGTFHFRQNNPPLESQPNERDDLAEPAEHIDVVNNFFFITYLLEYVDHLHRAGDQVHNRVGQGHFPDTYPNSDRPLLGLVHFPSDQGVVGVSGPTDTTSPETILASALGMDNAFSLSATVAGQVINPTAYGHGYLFNDLAKDGPVVYHEGMHSISSPIAGLRNEPEGRAMNEGQADLWAYSITDDEVLGNYVVNGWRRRERIRQNGGDPNLRQYIRHADSGLSYSQLGTDGGGAFEEHRDGEIYASAMWDLRELMTVYEAGGEDRYKRPALLTGSPTVGVSLGKETWERLFLGSIYLLGTMDPDTFVRARDAMIVADAALYPSDPLDPDAPGLHRAAIEQVFAAREIGVNAQASLGGRQTISTQVSPFAASQGRLAAPAGVTVAAASLRSNRIGWEPVSGAFAYEILRREVGKENRRQNRPVLGREYLDGDASTDGYLHVDYVPASATSYVDEGFIEEGFVRRGLDNPAGFEYVVRALNANANRQVGVSENSGAAGPPTAELDVTDRVEVALSNVVFAGGRTEFDGVLKNLGTGSADGVLYRPIAFTIRSISSPTVSVANADRGGTGQAGDPATFFFGPTLAPGASSASRHLIFNNPGTQLFVFEAAVTARVQVDPSAATRYQGEDFANYEPRLFTDVFTGIVPAMDAGAQLVGGVTYVDVPFTTRDKAFALRAVMSSPLTGGVDLDLELYDGSGVFITRSAGGTADESLVADVAGNARYFYRVIGWAGVAQDFRIESTQSALALKTSSQGTGTTPLAGTDTITSVLRFTVDPLTGTVTLQK